MSKLQGLAEGGENLLIWKESNGSTLGPWKSCSERCLPLQSSLKFPSHCCLSQGRMDVPEPSSTKEQKSVLSHVVGKLRTGSAERASDLSVTNQIWWLFWQITDLFKLWVFTRPAWELDVCIYLALESIALQNKIFIKKGGRNVMGTESGILWHNSSLKR